MSFDYNGSYTIMPKPIKSLQLHYPIIQFLKYNYYYSLLEKKRLIVNILDMLSSLVSFVLLPHFGQGMGWPLVYLIPFLFT